MIKKKIHSGHIRLVTLTTAGGLPQTSQIILLEKQKLLTNM